MDDIFVNRALDIVESTSRDEPNTRDEICKNLEYFYSQVKKSEDKDRIRMNQNAPSRLYTDGLDEEQIFQQLNLMFADHLDVNMDRNCLSNMQNILSQIGDKISNIEDEANDSGNEVDDSEGEDESENDEDEFDGEDSEEVEKDSDYYENASEDGENNEIDAKYSDVEGEEDSEAEGEEDSEAEGEEDSEAEGEEDSAAEGEEHSEAEGEEDSEAEGEEYSEAEGEEYSEVEGEENSEVEENEGENSEGDYDKEEDDETLDESRINEIMAKYSSDNEDGDSEVEDLALPSDESDEDFNGEEDMEEDEAEEEEDENNCHKKMKFDKSCVDDKYFNLRESEYIADEDLIGANNLDDIDLMEDIDEGAEGMSYEDFFEDEGNSEKKEEEVEGKDKDEGKEDDELFDEFESGMNEDVKEDESESNKTLPPSRLQKMVGKIAKSIEQIEGEMFEEKSWITKGEVVASSRPENTIHQEPLEFKSSERLKPEAVTEKLIHNLILYRFKNKLFDDVARKTPIVDNFVDFKKKLVLDDNPNQKSLTQIYEEEYLRKQNLEKSNEELPPKYKEAVKEVDLLLEELDALSNRHYTPKAMKAELRIIPLQKASQVEEATPFAVADSNRLAPEEVAKPMRGMLLSKEERTDTDRKRERRKKKQLQHVRAVKEEKKIESKTKKAEKEGKNLGAEVSTKIVQKAIKAGHVVQMDNQSSKVGSSKSFFKQLQETNGTESRKRKRSEI